MPQTELEGIFGGHLLQPLLFKQGHLELVAQNHVQKAFEGGGGIYHLGQSVPVLFQSHSEKVFPYAQRKPAFQFLPMYSFSDPRANLS